MIQLNEITGLLLIVISLSLLPFVAMVVTSYAKIVVVLGLLRNALGVQQVPPNMVLNGIAVLVSLYVMAPVGIATVNAMAREQISPQPSQAILQAYGAAQEPFRAFLKKHTNLREARFFIHSATAIWPPDAAKSLHEDDLIVLAPAFALTELTDAFKIGFMLYIAFIVVDLVIANVLLAMGLNQISPTNVAIPFKLLLFVVMDGWSALIHGLVLTYR
jgi:type III secretion protein R